VGDRAAIPLRLAEPANESEPPILHELDRLVTRQDLSGPGPGCNSRRADVLILHNRPARHLFK
jgi:hypothetical protein